VEPDIWGGFDHWHKKRKLDAVSLTRLAGDKIISFPMNLNNRTGAILGKKLPKLLIK
jgi:hypothetical protein